LDEIASVLPEQSQPFIQKNYFKTFPRRDEMDGFFVARLIKGIGIDQGT
jgi:16S rRNA C967 or C1407 C5-methylase (RsmB/RsmF family)